MITQVGEIFILESPDTVQELLSQKKGEVEAEVVAINQKVEAVRNVDLLSLWFFFFLIIILFKDLPNWSSNVFYYKYCKE